MRYGEGLLEEVLRRTDLVRLVGNRVRLQRKGHAFWALCPFHKEKSPSFKVENERRIYKCFGCGAGGNAFQWLMETEGLAFPEAVERLAAEAGVELPKWSPQDEAREQQRKSLHEILETACTFYEQQLRSPVGAAARSYLSARGLDEAAWSRFRLGYSPRARSALLDRLKSGGVAIEHAVAAGLAREGEPDQPARDFFFDRVMFPIGDAKGRVVAFGARALASDVQPKYINTGETALFSKGKLLYHYSAARAAAIKSGELIVAEGYMDVIALVGGGFEGAVAPLGTALTQDQLAILWRTAPEPILAFDGDEAGRRAAHRAAELALPLLMPGHSLRFAFLPTGEDPDSLIRAEGANRMRMIFDDAVPLIDFVWQIETEALAPDTPERKAALIARLNDRVRRIASVDIRRFYLEEIAQRVSAGLGLRAYVHNDQLRVSAGASSKTRTASPAGRRPFTPISPALKSNGLAASARRLRQSATDGIANGEPGSMARRMKEVEILALILDEPGILERQQEILAALPLSDRSLDSLRHELLNVAASGFRLETRGLEDHLVRAGMAALVGRLKARRAAISAEAESARRAAGGEGGADENELRWLRASAQLREMAEGGPERRQALERFKSEASEESWREWHRLVSSRAEPSE
jgi:DNA primase